MDRIWCLILPKKPAKSTHLHGTIQRTKWSVAHKSWSRCTFETTFAVGIWFSSGFIDLLKEVPNFLPNCAKNFFPSFHRQNPPKTPNNVWRFTPSPSPIWRCGAWLDTAHSLMPSLAPWPRASTWPYSHASKECRTTKCISMSPGGKWWVLGWFSLGEWFSGPFFVGWEEKLFRGVCWVMFVFFFCDVFSWFFL